MKEKTLREYGGELIASERFGSLAVREHGRAALEKWGCDADSLSALGSLFLDLAERACNRKEPDLTAAWLYLVDMAWDAARTNLSSEDYHRFCTLQSERESRCWWMMFGGFDE